MYKKVLGAALLAGRAIGMGSMVFADDPDVKNFTIAFEDQSLVPRAGTYKNTLIFVGEVNPAS